jgi:hypothetical protein
MQHAMIFCHAEMGADGEFKGGSPGVEREGLEAKAAITISNAVIAHSSASGERERRVGTTSLGMGLEPGIRRVGGASVWQREKRGYSRYFLMDSWDHEKDK